MTSATAGRTLTDVSWRGEHGRTSLGYRVVDDWSNREQSCTVPFTRGRDIDAYSGYYFVRD